jgi:ELWxxDGT repeat protein
MSLRDRRIQKKRLFADRTKRRKLSLEVLEERRLLAVDFQLLKDINALPSSSSPAALVQVGNVSYFTSTALSNGSALWKTDGTVEGTVLVKDLRPGVSGPSASELTNVGGTLFFTAYDLSGREKLWTSDGTAVGTRSGQG